MIPPVLLFAGAGDAIALGMAFGAGRAAMATGSVLSGDASWWNRQWASRERTIRVALSVLVVTILAWALFAR